MARFEIASKDQTRALEKAWAQYRKQHRLDIANGFTSLSANSRTLLWSSFCSTVSSKFNVRRTILVENAARLYGF